MEKIGKYITKYVKGKTPKELYEAPAKGLLPYLSPDYLRDKAAPEFYASPSSKTVQVDDGEVIILWDGSNAGEIFISKKGILASTMVKLDFDETEIYKPYYSYSFQNLEYVLKAKTAGSGIPHADKGVIKRLEFFKPEIPEQKAIATILSKVDEAIKATENSIKAAEKLKKSLMQNLLTGKLKPDGTWRKEDEFQNTIYGLIPKEWKYCKIQELVRKKIISEVQDGNHGEIHPVSAEFVSEGIPFVMASDISNGTIDFVNCKKISFERAEKLRIGFAIKDDVLLSHKASMGFTAIVPEFKPYIMLTPQVTYYRCNQDMLLPGYLRCFFQTYKFQKLFETYSVQSTRNFMGITNQKKMYMYLPVSIDEQRKIIVPIEEVSKQIESKFTKIEKLQRLKKSLMQNLLTGKVKVDLNRVENLLTEI